MALASGQATLHEALGHLVQLELGVAATSEALGLRLTERDTDHVEVSLGDLAAIVDSARVRQALSDDDSVFAHLLVALFPDLECPSTLALGDLQKQCEGMTQRRGAADESEARPPTTFSDRLIDATNAHPSAAVVGPSSSGKSVLCRQVEQSWQAAGHSVRSVNLSRPGISWLGLAFATTMLVAESREAEALLILDDVQSAPTTAEAFLAFWRSCEPPATLLLSAWPDASHVIDRTVPEEAQVRIDGASTATQIVGQTQAPWDARLALLQLASGDALVADVAARFYVAERRVPSEREIAQLAYRSIAPDTLDEPQLRALYLCACLATFEIDLELIYVPAAYRAAINELAHRGILKTTDPYLHLGHKSFARLVALHLLENEPVVAEEPVPAEIAVSYLRAAGPAQTKQTLDRLDLVSVAATDDQFGAAFLARCWNSLRVLAKFASKQTATDRTWGDDVASATFAGEAFAALGMLEEWRATAAYVRARWIVPNDSDLPHTESETNELDDFNEILKRMAIEDEQDPNAYTLHAGDVDRDRFHKSWVLGLLLGFEGSALEPDSERRARLLAIAAANQLPNGAFYPDRVPWVTARVILGLVACGESIPTSKVLTDAAAWLRSARPEGPYDFGVWHPGTGTWNTELQTTAIALLALGRSGLSPADNAIDAGITYLREGRDEWARQGKEIDCAQAIEASIVLGASWREFFLEIRTLLQWAADPTAWSTATRKASDVQDEGSKLASVASSLIGIVWATVRMELPVLFEGVVGAPPSSDAIEGPPDWIPEALVAVSRAVELAAENVRDRELVVKDGRASSTVVDYLRTWRRHLAEAQRLESVLRQPTLLPSRNWTEVLDEINAFGKDCLGDAWNEIA
jgi:hypothetical protein